MNYHIYLAKHNETDKVFVGRTTRLPIKLSFRDSNRRGAGELGQLLREGGLGKFTLTLIDTVSTAEEASKKFNALVAELDCYEPKGLNHNQFGDRNSRYGVRWKGHKGRKLVSTPWKYPLGSKPWHRLPPDMVYQPQILGRIPRSQSVTHYVRREVGNGVTDYMTLLNGIIAGLRDGSILPKPESWLIIHSIIKQTLMAKVYTPQGTISGRN